jgi:hypothetical protein
VGGRGGSDQKRQRQARQVERRARKVEKKARKEARKAAEAERKVAYPHPVGVMASGQKNERLGPLVVRVIEPNGNSFLVHEKPETS